MACPVVTTAVGAMGFPIQDGVQALFAETADDFAAALRRLIGSPEMRQRIGDNARAMIRDRFTWDLVAEDLLNVVAEAVVSR